MYMYVYIQIYICMYICIYIYIYLCIYIYIYICMYAFKYIYIHIYIDMKIYVYVCTYICIYIYIYIHTHTHTHIYMNVCTYIYMYTYACINIRIYIHTHAQSLHPYISDTHRQGKNLKRRWRSDKVGTCSSSRPVGASNAATQLRRTTHLPHVINPPPSVCRDGFRECEGGGGSSRVGGAARSPAKGASYSRRRASCVVSLCVR